MAGFDWDKANIEHVARHGMTPEEFEQVLANQPLFGETTTVKGETRTFEVGQTDAGRVLVVVWTLRNHLRRAVTAFDAPRPLRADYSNERKKQWH